MKRYNYLISASLLIVLAASCAKEMDSFTRGDGCVRFVAGFEGDTRTSLDGTRVLWTSGDAISIFDGSSNVKSVTESSGATATFEATLQSEGPWYALYPYSTGAAISGSVVNTTVASDQRAVNGSFSEGANVSMARSDNGNLIFKNVLSYIKFTVGQDNICNVTLTGLGNEALAGEVEVDYNDGNPTWTVKSAAKAIVLKAPAGSMTFAKGDTYYIGVLPQTFNSGIKLEFLDASGEKFAAEHAASLTLSRSHIYNIGVPDEKIEFDSIIEFEDKDVEADLIRNLHIDTNGDGKISKSECAAVTYDQLLALSCNIDTNNHIASAAPLWSDPSLIDSFRELKYFTGLLTTIQDGNTGLYDYRLPPIFAQCVNLVDVEFPISLSNVANYCFQGCEKLDTVIFTQNMRSVFAYTFNGCTGLKYVKIPDIMSSIGNNAFQGCSSLAKLDFDGNNNSIKSIGNYSFDGCASMQFSSRNLTKLSSIGNYAFQNCAKIVNLTITSADLKKISKYAFSGCTKLATVKVSASLNEIGDYAFSKCPVLTTLSYKDSKAGCGIELPAAVTVYPQYCFRECGAITKMNIPEGVTTIGDRAFAGMKSLTELVLPSTLTSMVKRAFEGSGTNYPVHLTKLVCKAVVPPTCGGSAPGSGKEPTVDAVYVPATSVSAYKAAAFWSTYSAIISAIE